MRLIRIIINITIPFFLVILFASLLTTKPYLMLSKGLYDSHDDITFDHEYAIERVIGYLNYRYDDLDFGATPEDDDIIMRDTELRHMVDVKNLYTYLRLAALGALLIGGSLSYYLYRKDKNELYQTYRTMPLFPIFFILFVGGYMIIDFDTAFTAFHLIFFNNDDWILYADDVLIQMLPQMFWMVSGLIILALFSATIAGLYALNEKIVKKRTM